MEKDVNEAFENIFLSEERITSTAYREGFQKGEQEENFSGYHLGYHKGAEIGAELGYYLGIIETQLIIEENKNNKKVYPLLEKVKILINEFPKTNNHEIDLTAKLDEIRAIYKRCCSLLKINGKLSEDESIYL